MLYFLIDHIISVTCNQCLKHTTFPAPFQPQRILPWFLRLICSHVLLPFSITYYLYYYHYQPTTILNQTPTVSSICIWRVKQMRNNDALLCLSVKDKARDSPLPVTCVCISGVIHLFVRSVNPPVDYFLSANSSRDKYSQNENSSYL